MADGQTKDPNDPQKEPIVGLSGKPNPAKKETPPPVIQPESQFVPPSDDDTEDGKKKQRRTALHTAMNETWGLGSMHYNHYNQLQDMANLEKAKKSKNGFLLELNNGTAIEWRAPTQHAPEMIVGDAKKFDQQAADAIIVMARVRGWSDINVHGSVEQKEMLWLAVQVQNLKEKEAFDASKEKRDREDKAEYDRLKAEGKLPKDKDGNVKEFEPAQFVPSRVANFEPVIGSAVIEQYKAIAATYAKAPTPYITEAKPAERNPEPPLPPATRLTPIEIINSKFVASEPKNVEDHLDKIATNVKHTAAKPPKGP